jgi:predicted RNA-binding protein YlxR (DUF448 family)
MQQPGINNEIEAYIKARIELGAKKYGRTIYVDDKRDFLQEALEEALDMSVYLAGELIKLKNLKEKLMTTEEEHIDDKLYEEHEEQFQNHWSMAIDELAETIDLPRDRTEKLFFMYTDKMQKYVK